jgi:hypothetical protein
MCCVRRRGPEDCGSRCAAGRGRCLAAFGDCNVLCPTMPGANALRHMQYTVTGQPVHLPLCGVPSNIERAFGPCLIAHAVMCGSLVC